MHPEIIFAYRHSEKRLAELKTDLTYRLLGILQPYVADEIVRKDIVGEIMADQILLKLMYDCEHHASLLRSFPEVNLEPKKEESES